MGKRSFFGLDPDQLNELMSLGADAEGLPEDNQPDSDADQKQAARAEVMKNQPTASLGAVERPGGRIGRYKLLRILGEGGMGMVYLAEQERPVRRRVALKVIKPGMDTKQVIARFEAERQALALLDHPSIAHVYDAGSTEASRPYFVMEYVKGIPITKHCDRYKLTVEERLKLFLAVCEAVQHAHQKAIIHRDLKPSNILVTANGEKATPKIIDFGVAKAIGQPLTERTLLTEQGQFVGTPEYMSPEQADLTTQDIDTRSDVYSLGVVLYELLTGVLPFDSETFRRGGIEHVRRMIREEEPKTPSIRLSATSGEESTKLAQLRRTDVRSLGRQLHGDLDWISLKAMEKDQARRYQTAHALAEDIQRHLDSEPVLAGPPSRIYRLKKFIQKHRAQAIGTAVAVVLLAVIAVISVLLFRAAERSREVKPLKHQNILSQAMEYHSRGQYEDALTELGPILNSEHVGPEARWLRARTVLQLRGPTEATTLLEDLTKERDEIASQAHFLLARIYLETDPDDLNDVATYQLKGREHHQKGEELFSESPEAYYNRALMAGTVNKTLEYLNKALESGQSHYDSLEARALAYYALRQYDDMEIDASVMIGNAPDNPRGYALRAVARREEAMQEGDKERLTQAIRDHNAAIRLLRDDAELYDQRRRTYVQMGDYERALSDAQECVQLQPEKGMYHFHVFCVLVAVGDYDQAKVKYEAIVRSDLMKDERPFDQLSEAYVFDVLDAGLPWHPPASEPKGAPFLPMVQADRHYRRLVKQARKVVPDGFAPAWSPDGTSVVYSRGVLGFSGIEIINVKTGRTRLLTASGFDPAWSPDGRHIAFVRGRRTVLLPDLTMEHTRRQPRLEHREVWLIKADGSEEPRFVAKGSWPLWRDSRRIYYSSPEAQRVCLISIDEGSEPEPITWFPSYYGTVSPDGRYFADAQYFSGFLRVLDLSQRSVHARWAGPRGALFASWSPDGRRLTVAAGTGPAMGLWIYDMEAGEALKFISGRIMRGRWSPDETQMVFAFGPPHNQIWVADTAALGPGQTLAQHDEEVTREHVEGLTLKIEAFPENADSYRWRAEGKVYLGDTQGVVSDLEAYTDLVSNPTIAAEAYHGVAWRWVLRNQETVDPEFIVGLYRTAHEMQPRNWEYLCGLGAAYYRAGQYAEAITTLRKSTGLFYGKNAVNYFFLAMAHWQLGNTGVATDWYEKAMRGMQNTDNDGTRAARTRYDTYLEASELMGVELRRFPHADATVGKLTYDDTNDMYTVLGSGRDIWGVADQFHFAWKKLTGDGSISVKIESVEAVHDWTKAGVMIRNTLAGDSEQVSLVLTPLRRVSFQHRPVPGGACRRTSTEPETFAFPHWIKLSRDGNVFRAQHSSDGADWQEIEPDSRGGLSSVSLTMDDPVYIGLAVTSHAGGIPAEAKISKVTTTGDVEPLGEFLAFEGIGFKTTALPDK